MKSIWSGNRSYGRLDIDWDALSEYEREDNTSGSRELAARLVCVRLLISMPPKKEKKNHPRMEAGDGLGTV